MTTLDLKQLIDSSSIHTLYDTLDDKIKNSSIVKVYMVSGECFKIKGDKNTHIVKITPDYITVSFDSHISDIMYTGIVYIEYYGGLYGRNNIK